MKNKTCANIGEDGKAVTELGVNEAPAALRVKRSRVPLYRIVLDRTGSIAKEGTAVVTHGLEAAKLFRQFLGDVPEEHFLLMVLSDVFLEVSRKTLQNRKNRPYLNR